MHVKIKCGPNKNTVLQGKHLSIEWPQHCLCLSFPTLQMLADLSMILFF